MVYQYRNSLILKHKFLYYCIGTFCCRRDWKDSHRGMKIRNRLLLYSYHLPFMLHSHPHFSQLRACRRKAQIAASNKQNLKMKPADAQRLPCHKMREKNTFPSTADDVASVWQPRCCNRWLSFLARSTGSVNISVAARHHVWKLNFSLRYTTISTLKNQTRRGIPLSNNIYSY